MQKLHSIIKKLCYLLPLWGLGGFLWGVGGVYAQEVITKKDLEYKDILLNNMMIQMEVTSAVDDMYNFNFERAENQFNWFKSKYPTHPLPYFLLGLNEWWKMMPNPDIKTYDKKFLAYMDSSITFAEKILKQNKKEKISENAEPYFFLAGAYAFKARLHAERGNYSKAIGNTKSAYYYLKYDDKFNDLSPEFMFGNALYNYYAVWLNENYVWLRPVLIFFRKGNKAKGLELLDKASKNAFYTRIEALYFLMRIYRYEEEKPALALPTAQYLHHLYPNNAYFQRMYASVLYSMGNTIEMEQQAQSMMQKIEQGYTGYEAISGRYASFYLAYSYQWRHQDEEKAILYYQKTCDFARQSQHYDSGYFHSSLTQLARLSHKRGNTAQAKIYFTELRKYTKRKNPNNKEARRYMKENRR